MDAKRDIDLYRLHLFILIEVSLSAWTSTCLRAILPYWMIAEAEAWTPNMALLLLGSCCVFVSYAVTMAVDRQKDKEAFFSPAQLIKLIKKPKRGELRAVWRVGNFKHSKGSAVITQGRALGTLNVLNSKWTMAMNFIKKIPFHFKFEGCHV